jgi:hypothetical protein
VKSFLPNWIRKRDLSLSFVYSIIYLFSEGGCQNGE